MKIAYIIYPGVIISNKSNGIRSQAVEWAEILRAKGITIDLIDNWGDYNWRSYDAIHLFGSGLWVCDIIRALSEINDRIVISPIMDPTPSFSMLGSDIRYYLSKTKFFNSRVYMIANAFQKSKCLCVRSEFEKKFVAKVYKISENVFKKVPLAFDTKLNSLNWTENEKEDFCLHISSIYQERKNVLRLIEAAKKFGFKLVLAGNKGTEAQFEKIGKAIEGRPNISVLGFVSYDEKIALYRRAKVFALPSLQEGVGIVALDAAKMGCEVAITNIPGPKEYYEGKCMEVDPYNVDSIGNSIMALLAGEKRFQPTLSKYISNKYSSEAVAQNLIEMYKAIK